MKQTIRVTIGHECIETQWQQFTENSSTSGDPDGSDTSIISGFLTPRERGYGRAGFRCLRLFDQGVDALTEDLARKDAALNLLVAKHDVKIAEVSAKILTAPVGTEGKLISERLSLEQERDAFLKAIADIRNQIRLESLRRQNEGEANERKRKEVDEPHELKRKVHAGKITCSNCGGPVVVGKAEVARGGYWGTSTKDSTRWKYFWILLQCEKPDCMLLERYYPDRPEELEGTSE